MKESSVVDSEEKKRLSFSYLSRRTRYAFGLFENIKDVSSCVYRGELFSEMLLYSRLESSFSLSLYLTHAAPIVAGAE